MNNLYKNQNFTFEKIKNISISNLDSSKPSKRDLENELTGETHLEKEKRINGNLEFKESSEETESLLNKLTTRLENLPVYNEKYDFMILETNLGIADNLKNIFFLEFDIMNNQNESQGNSKSPSNQATSTKNQLTTSKDSVKKTPKDESIREKIDRLLTDVNNEYVDKEFYFVLKVSKHKI